ncbi:MAG: sensor domain-containing diguanylate cyclase [Candidatus Omnitrophica bacterium]|nr:sensor domain-containing diguanylate cyclase [Candidatus Omnitrophota bacterium]
MKTTKKTPKAQNKHLSELQMLYEISMAMRSTLRLDEILYIILTSVTAREGLGFNRSMVFLVNEKNNTLEGRMGIGPASEEDANQIWNYIKTTHKTLDDLLSDYKEFGRRTNSLLNNIVKDMNLPIEPASGILAQTVISKSAFEITNKKAKANIKKKDPLISLFNMEYFIAVPLVAKNRVVGVMIVDNFYSKRSITKDDIWKLNMFANQAGLAIENSQEFEKTLILSNTDRLTGLWNYGYFQHQLAEDIKRANRFNRHLSLLMLDIDFFKNFNDTLGHVAGDKLLKEIADIFRNSCREVDIVARYGGEEFAIILPETFKEKAYSSAERIRKSTAAHQFHHKEGAQGKRITISIGVASFPQDASTVQDLICYADKALYAAKETGRNRVCMFSKELI